MSTMEWIKKNLRLIGVLAEFPKTDPEKIVGSTPFLKKAIQMYKWGGYRVDKNNKIYRVKITQCECRNCGKIFPVVNGTDWICSTKCWAEYLNSLNDF